MLDDRPWRQDPRWQGLHNRLVALDTHATEEEREWYRDLAKLRTEHEAVQSKIEALRDQYYADLISIKDFAYTVKQHRDRLLEIQRNMATPPLSADRRLTESVQLISEMHGIEKRFERTSS